MICQTSEAAAAAEAAKASEAAEAAAAAVLSISLSHYQSAGRTCCNLAPSGPTPAHRI